MAVSPGTHAQHLEAIAAAADDPALGEPAERQAARRFADRITGDLPGFIEWYGRSYGNVLDMDAVRLYSPDYAASPEARRAFTRATKAVAGKAVGCLFAHHLAQPADKGVVRFNAGGMASGKSTSSSAAGAALVDFILDTTLGGGELAQLQISQVLDTGRRVHLQFIYAPFDQVVWAMILRSAGDAGRYVTLPKLAAAHHKAARNALRFAAELDPDEVALSVIDNTCVKGRYLGVARDEDWLAQRLNPSVETLLHRAREIVEEQWRLRAGHPAYTEALRRLILAEE